ncbi:MAG TPA: KUP/HAK/KT family potassium transporter, partial [Acidimicrobiales bacterium]|nr:KUP/HAK/KT family potassium transporter [Acidimicrobiales bacterium]
MATSRDEAAEDAPAPAGGPATGAVGLPQRGRTGLLAVGALGVVYGDIGTNPLFAMREAFDAHHLPLTEDNVIGLLSLMVWSLIVVISLKYLSFVMRADNDGEGGILALTTLA